MIRHFEELGVRSQNLSMTRIPFDQLAKEFLQELLAPYRDTPLDS